MVQMRGGVAGLHRTLGTLGAGRAGPSRDAVTHFALGPPKVALHLRAMSNMFCIDHLPSDCCLKDHVSLDD